MRRHSGLTVLLVLAVIVLSNVIVSAQGQYGGSLRIATTTSPPTLDTMANTHTATREIGMNIYETIVAFNGNYEVVPMLAESWDISDDGLVYTFHLREGVPFHNGDIMEAEDVKASVERYIAVSPMNDNLEILQDITVLDKHTVQMTLNRSSGAFLSNLAQPKSLLGIMPKEVAEGAEARHVDIVGTGPYKLDEWIPDRHTKLSRFEDYVPFEGVPASGFAGKKVAYIDELYYIPVPEAGSRVAGLETGEYDFVDFLPGMDIPYLQEQDNLVIEDLMPYTWVVVYLNHTEDSIFNNKTLRQAVQAGIDHEEIMIVSSDDSGRLDPGMYFLEQVWHSDVGAEYYNQNDPEKAKKLMEEAGYNGEEIVLLTNTDYDYMYKAGIVLERQLTELGFNVNMKVLDWPGQLDVRADLSQWDLSFSSHSTRFDPVENNNYFFPATTFFGYDNPQMADALSRAADHTLVEDRYAAYEEAQLIFYEDVAMLKLYDLGIWQGWREHLKGYEPWYMLYFVNAWIDK